MALKAAPIAWFTAKWLLVPLALAGVGYYLIGPKIGDVQIPGVKRGPKVAQNAPVGDPEITPANDNGNAAPAPAVANKKYAEPKVEVSVRRGGTMRGRHHTLSEGYVDEYGNPRRRRHRSSSSSGTPRSERRRRSSRDDSPPASPAPYNGGGGGDFGGDSGGSTGGVG